MCHAVLKKTLLVAAVLPGMVFGGDWQTSNSIRVSSYVSDNVSQSKDGSAGVGITVVPRIGLIGRGARINGQLGYAPVLHTAFGDNAPDGRINHTLQAGLSSTLVRNRLFVDSSASARMVDTSGVAHGDGSTIANDRNTSQTYSFSVSPYAVNRFGRAARLITRVGFNTVQGDSGARAVNSTGLSASMQLANGEDFTRLPWSMAATHREVSYDNRDDVRDSFDATLGYIFDRHWRLDGQVGYQNFDISTARSTTSGATYSTTAYWTPNPRLAFEAQVGKQYFGTFWRAEVNHTLKRVSWSLDTRREVTNTRSAIYRGFTVDELSSAFTAEQLAQLDPDELIVLGINIDEDYLVTSLGGDFTVRGNRTTGRFNARFEQREYEITRRTQDISTFTLSGTRRMGGGISANASASFQDVQSDLTGDSQYLRLTIGASKSLGRHTRLGVDLSRVERTGDSSRADFTEHRIGLVLSTRMF